MNSVLVFIEHAGGEVAQSSLCAVAAAQQAKKVHGYGEIIGLVVGKDNVAAAAGIVGTSGVDKVLTVTHPALEHSLAEQVTAAICAACAEVSPKLILGLATSVGKDVFPRVAARLSVSQASDVIGFTENRTYDRPMFAGNVIATVALESDAHVVTVRGSAFDQPEKSGLAAPVQELPVDVPTPSRATFVSLDSVTSERPELTEASVVVSGGRALKSTENFETVLFPLADALNGAVGASRAAVDAGYVPNDWQVGQTGKIVAPNLYIAVGISGAVQHLAGMKDSKVIVAINKDADAPIFEVADYGLVADLFEAVPEMVSLLQK